MITKEHSGVWIKNARGSAKWSSVDVIGILGALRTRLTEWVIHESWVGTAWEVPEYCQYKPVDYSLHYMTPRGILGELWLSDPWELRVGLAPKCASHTQSIVSHCAVLSSALFCNAGNDIIEHSGSTRDQGEASCLLVMDHHPLIIISTQGIALVCAVSSCVCSHHSLKMFFHTDYRWKDTSSSYCV